MAFIHFGMNTFTDREWGFGNDLPDLFNPTDFSADQIADTVRDGDFAGLIITAKHHDGFCLWPSQYSDYSVKQAPWRNGQGDVVGDLAAACKARDLRFGVYLSPWDRHRADYGHEGYVQFYMRQLHELLTRYGPVCEVWFDGANGGDGWYGGAAETRHIDAETYYRWPEIFALVRKLQPEAVIFAPQGGDVRWIGNEAGRVTSPCWPIVPKGSLNSDILPHGMFGAPVWRPAEVDVSIRPGWFWHEEENGSIRSAAELFDLMFATLGSGANLLLNLPPDRRGRIPALDRDAVRGMAALWRGMLARDYAGAGHITASDTENGRSGDVLLVDDVRYWQAPASVRDVSLKLMLPTRRRFDVVMLSEPLSCGVTIQHYEIEVQEHPRGAFRRVAGGEAVGHCCLVALGGPVEAIAMRVRLFSSDRAPALRRLALYREPKRVYPPTIMRDERGLVVITARDGAAVLYTADGTDPASSGTLYRKPFLFAGGTVRACLAMHAAETGREAIYGLLPTLIRIVEASAPGAEVLLTGRGGGWRSSVGPGHSARIVMTFPARTCIYGVVLTPVEGEPAPVTYAVANGDDGREILSGRFDNMAANAASREIRFREAVCCTRLVLTFSRATGESPVLSIGSLKLLSR